MTTSIDFLLDMKTDLNEPPGNSDLNLYLTDSDDETDNLPKIIMCLSNDVKTRLDALEEYYASVGDNAIDTIKTLACMYQMSGTSSLQQFFYLMCQVQYKVSPFLKLTAANSLLNYEILEDGTDSDDDEDENQLRIEQDEEIRQQNKESKILGYKALNKVCQDLNDMSTPCRIDAIFSLMNSSDFFQESDNYFKEFICDDSIDCDFRYNTILSLEKEGARVMREAIKPRFSDKTYISHIYSVCKARMKELFGTTKYDSNDEYFWCNMIDRLNYNDLKHIYSNDLFDYWGKLTECGRDEFIFSAMLTFIFHDKNMTSYRVLAGQYLLQKCGPFDITDETRDSIEVQLLTFACDQDLDYNLRADAADVLMNTSKSDIMKQNGLAVITELSNIDGKVRTVFDNAQNVHTNEVEESVAEALEFLSALPLHSVNKKSIDFSYVKSQVEKLIVGNENGNVNNCPQIASTNIPSDCCNHCENKISENEKIQKLFLNKTEIIFCSENCKKLFSRNSKIRISLNRIVMDRAMYSKYNSTLVNILLKVWSYLVQHDSAEEMKKRMIEELEEMSGTCSSGFASRLINVISGFGEFNIRISWEDQVIANFSGRLNAAARDITSINSVFRNERKYDVVEVWLNNDENNGEYVKARKHLEDTRYQDIKYCGRNTICMRDITDQFLSTYPLEKIQTCIEDFADAVIIEMTTASSKNSERLNFSLFFRVFMSTIREELHEEFKDLITDTDFDLYFRKAIMRYDGDM